jgi:hypothetical protein
MPRRRLGGMLDPQPAIRCPVAASNAASTCSSGTSSETPTYSRAPSPTRVWIGQPVSLRQTVAPVAGSYAARVGPGPTAGAPATTSLPAAYVTASISPSWKSGGANPASGAPVARS